MTRALIAVSTGGFRTRSTVAVGRTLGEEQDITGAEEDVGSGVGVGSQCSLWG